MKNASDRVVTITNIVSAYLLLATLGVWIGVVVTGFGPASNPIDLRMETSEPHSPAQLERQTDPQVRLLFAGDIMQHWEQQFDDFSISYAGLEELIRNADLTVANLEFPVFPFAPVGPGLGSVRFNGSVEHVRALGEVGVDVLVTANNHAFDQGMEGLRQTIKIIRRSGMVPLGTAESQAELARPYVEDVAGIRVGILAYTYGVNPIVRGPEDLEFPPRDLPVHTLNFLEWSGIWRDRGLQMIRRHVNRARGDGAEFLVAYCHWGEEWDFSPSEHQRAAAHDLIDGGFDLVIGSHAHVLQGPEVYKGRLIAYSLGSLISDFRPWEVRTAALLEIGLARYGGRIYTVGFSYHPTFVEPDGHRVTLLDARARGVQKRAFELSLSVLGPAAEIKNRDQ